MIPIEDEVTMDEDVTDGTPEEEPLEELEEADPDLAWGDEPDEDGDLPEDEGAADDMSDEDPVEETS